MRRSVCTWVTALGTAIGLAGSLAAQERDVPAQQDVQVQDRDLLDQTDRAQQQRPAQIIPHGEIVGLQIVGADGQELGQIEGLVVGLLDGMIRYAAVSGDQLVEGGDRLVALPWAALELQREQGQDELQQARLAMNAQMVRQAESFAEDQQWPAMPDAALLAAAQRELGQDRVRLGFRGDAEGQKVTAIKISEDVNVDVKNTTGETIGQVKRFMIDPQEAKVAFVTVGKGGVLGVGETLTALPMEALEFEQSQEDRDQYFFALTISPEAFQQAPKVGENPQFSEISQQVEKFRSEHLRQTSDSSADRLQPQP